MADPYGADLASYRATFAELRAIGRVVSRVAGTVAVIGGATRVFALLGDPVAHSLSPAMQNAAFRALGLGAVYVAAALRRPPRRRR